ncbi:MULTISPECIES: chorismate-binding protein [unclassified Neorhizobium]|uniref:chorismate-binding protein n=1 Tax=unclassified Neorhizobium TaxID=2629175 RepID=UPI001FF36DD7|nr:MULTISPECIES: chorismate-binding protein [unclassified Neorhizobium]MCJ9674141.1 chorismate-binding protein [Neorhizobium sp. SHOUNA12B]MCJ9748914.1 chorismate-binding protein [Neorhizobium sp. SHOUNA12A]
MTPYNSGEDVSYWERACDFFRMVGASETEGSYFIHNKNSNMVKIGIMCRAAVSIDEGVLSCTEDGEKTVVDSHSEADIFKHIEKLLKRDAPYFFIVSPDIHRRFVDKELPQAVFVQPSIEFVFSPDRKLGQISFSRDFASERQGGLMLRAFSEELFSAQPNCLGEPLLFSEMVASWISAEDDESFLKRLDDAISILQDFPDGKMTLTRAYEYRLAAKHDPFKLYELHASMNGDYACSHFFCVRKDVFALGSSPENIFELDDRTLMVDVVAATCKPSDDGEFLATELYDNPKQLKEHRSSLVNRMNRFNAFCEGGSIKVTKELQIKKLRNVFHLYSIFMGKLLISINIFDLLGNIFPLLGARPKELLAIADAERAPHRYYGGVVGHMHLQTGGCFLNIRNALLNDYTIHVKVGVGVLKESSSSSELIETQDKISGLMEAIHLWEESFHAEEDPEAASLGRSETEDSKPKLQNSNKDHAANND